MSASASPVVSPRKGKHTRSKGLNLTSPAIDSKSRFSGGQFALPANVDILTLDSDDAFVRFSVRDVQAIEASLQSTHDHLSSNLRSLVSEKYRDMLGTANTLIEMSSSATNLVKRLDAVRQGVDKARAQRDSNGKTSVKYPEDVASTPHEKNISVRLNAIAAATKLLAESPDDVWRAIESASLDGVALIPAKRALLGREMSNFKAATALRAAWIYILCQEAWKWLVEEKHEMEFEKDVDIETLFPYISKQRLGLNSMKAALVNVSHVGLEGWLTSDSNNRKRWEDVSSSYMATITSLLSASFLEGFSIKSSRELLLKQRKRAIKERLHHRTYLPTNTMTRMVRVMAETMAYSLRAFVIVDDGFTLPHLATIFESMDGSSAHGEQLDFPPNALQALSTLPSASIFVEHLPSSVRHFTPRLDYADAEECKQTTIKVLQDWSISLRTEQEASLTRLVDKLSTISSIGEAQIQLRESLDRCCNLIAKVCPQKEENMRILVEQQIKELVALLEGLLLRRLDIICQERTAELPAAVSNSISSALTLLSSTNQLYDITLEKNPTKFLFDPDLSTPSLETRLRIQTPLVKKVLLSVEQHAKSLGEEMEAYAAYVQRDARKRAKRKQKLKKQSVNSLLSNVEESQMDRVLHSYRSAFDSARIALTDELNKRLETITQSDIEEDKSIQFLYIIRIVSAFQHSTVLQSSNSMAAKGSNDLFLLRLEELRRNVITRWIKEVVKEATSMYFTKVKHCLDPRTDQLGRPSPAFVDSMMRIVDGIQAVGCGYQSEVSVLGQEILSAFANSWLDLQAKLDEQDLRCYTFDSHALCILFADHPGTEEIIFKLKSISSSLNDQATEQIEKALQRLRLILTPFRRRDSQLQSQSKSPADGFTSAPPLPMLSIIQGKERVTLLL